MKANNAINTSGGKEGKLNDNAVEITFAPGVDRRNIRPGHLNILRRACADSGNRRAVITSGFRSIESQVKAMFANLQKDYNGQRRLYLAAGQKIIDIFDTCRKEGKTTEETLAAMVGKAKEIGPGNVSRHCDTAACVLDIGISSLDNADALAQEMKKYASKVLDERPNGNRCIHIELR